MVAGRAPEQQPWDGLMDDGALVSSRSCDVEFEGSRAANRDSGNNALTRWLRILVEHRFWSLSVFLCGVGHRTGFRSTALGQAKEGMNGPPLLSTGGAGVVQK